MRLWTIQPEIVYELIKTDKVFCCNPSKSEFMKEWGFSNAYDWIADQMKLRIGKPSGGIKYPIWAWHTLYWKHQKPDLRRMEFRNYRGNQVCIEFEIPSQKVLLSDEELWHLVLSDSYIYNSNNEKKFEVENEWFESLSKHEQKMYKEKSWEQIFNISTPIDTEWNRCGMFIQATIWELRLEQIISVRYFKGKI